MDLTDDALDHRVPTPQDLALIVKLMRENNKWTQATLAELSGITERTVQRAENAEPTTFDTRRALAKGFGLDNIDAFNEPWPFPDPEKLKAHTAELERTTALVAITPIRSGQSLRKMAEGTHAWLAEEIGDPPQKAREAFAGLVDQLKDYDEARDLYDQRQRLELDCTLDKFLQTIFAERQIVGAGLRHTHVRSEVEDRTTPPMPWTSLFVLLTPANALPANIRVPKRFSLV